jgi:hypothetical protein
MKRFQLWVRLSSTQTMNTIVYAENLLFAKQIGEAQFGSGNVLDCNELDN